MAGLAEAQMENNPVVSFNFMLEVEALYFLPCRKVHSFKRENEYQYIQEGGLNDYVHIRRKPISNPFTFQVERYVGSGFTNFVDPLANGTELALPVLLYVNRYETKKGTWQAFPARIYMFTGCTVISKEYGELNAEQSGLLTETTTIAYRQMMMLTAPVESGTELDPWTMNKKVYNNDGSLKDIQGARKVKYAKQPDIDKKSKQDDTYQIEPQTDGLKHMVSKSPDAALWELNSQLIDKKTGELADIMLARAGKRGRLATSDKKADPYEMAPEGGVSRIRRKVDSDSTPVKQTKRPQTMKEMQTTPKPKWAKPAAKDDDRATIVKWTIDKAVISKDGAIKSVPDARKITRALQANVDKNNLVYKMDRTSGVAHLINSSARLPEKMKTWDDLSKQGKPIKPKYAKKPDKDEDRHPIELWKIDQNVIDKNSGAIVSIEKARKKLRARQSAIDKANDAYKLEQKGGVSQIVAIAAKEPGKYAEWKALADAKKPIKPKWAHRPDKDEARATAELWVIDQNVIDKKTGAISSIDAARKKKRARQSKIDESNGAYTLEQESGVSHIKAKAAKDPGKYKDWKDKADAKQPIPTKWAKAPDKDTDRAAAELWKMDPSVIDKNTGAISSVDGARKKLRARQSKIDESNGVYSLVPEDGVSHISNAEARTPVNMKVLWQNPFAKYAKAPVKDTARAPLKVPTPFKQQTGVAKYAHKPDKDSDRATPKAPKKYKQYTDEPQYAHKPDKNKDRAKAKEPVSMKVLWQNPFAKYAKSPDKDKARAPLKVPTPFKQQTGAAKYAKRPEKDDARAEAKTPLPVADYVVNPKAKYAKKPDKDDARAAAKEPTKMADTTGAAKYAHRPDKDDARAEAKEPQKISDTGAAPKYGKRPDKDDDRAEAKEPQKISDTGAAPKYGKRPDKDDDRAEAKEPQKMSDTKAAPKYGKRPDKDDDRAEAKEPQKMSDTKAAPKYGKRPDKDDDRAEAKEPQKMSDTKAAPKYGKRPDKDDDRAEVKEPQAMASTQAAPKYAHRPDADDARAEKKEPQAMASTTAAPKYAHRPDKDDSRAAVKAPQTMSALKSTPSPKYAHKPDKDGDRAQARQPQAVTPSATTPKYATMPGKDGDRAQAREPQAVSASATTPKYATRPGSDGDRATAMEPQAVTASATTPKYARAPEHDSEHATPISWPSTRRALMAQALSKK